MKILLLILRLNSKPFEEPGIASIASVLRSRGHDVTIKICNVDCMDREFFKKLQPDIIGSSSYDDVIEYQLLLLKEIHNIVPKAKICLGGYSATYNYREIMNRYSFIDFCMLGEGEEPWIELTNSANINPSEVPNLVYRDDMGNLSVNDQLPLIENLDQLPIAARDVLVNADTKFAQLTTSRGCTHNCSFCLSSKFWKSNKRRIWRGQSIDRVIAELIEITQNNRCRKIIFNDNSFEDPDNGKRALSIANAIIHNQIEMYYLINLRVDFVCRITDEYMDRLIESGLVTVFIGIESGNDEDLILYNKRTTVADNDNALAFLSRFDISVGTGFINFNPYTTVERLKKNTEFLYRHRLAANFMRMTKSLKPYKGTDIFQRIKDDGLLMTNESSIQFNFLFEHSEVKAIFEVLLETLKNYPILKETTYLDIELHTTIVILSRVSKRIQKSCDYANIMRFKKSYDDLMNELNEMGYSIMSYIFYSIEKGEDIDTMVRCVGRLIEVFDVVRKIEGLLTNRDALFSYLRESSNRYDTLLF